MENLKQMIQQKHREEVLKLLNEVEKFDRKILFDAIGAQKEWMSLKSLILNYFEEIIDELWIKECSYCHYYFPYEEMIDDDYKYYCPKCVALIENQKND